MIDTGRVFMMDIFDYSGNKLCSLYDSSIDLSGQAVNVVMTTERNGWKELSFDLPCVCNEIDGEHENYRLQFLKAEYRIRTWDGKDIDWFLISGPKITHSNYSKKISVKAGHISQLLKTKNLDLEFSDEEGNNVGTAAELITTILDGTGWQLGKCEEFKEDSIFDLLTSDPGDMDENYEKYYTFDSYHNFYKQLSNPVAWAANTYYVRQPKYRSLKAAAKTGAFKMISSVCELFDAKPVYRSEVYDFVTDEHTPDDWPNNWEEGHDHYYWKDESNGMYMQVTSQREYTPNFYYKRRERVIDILPLNPFTEPEEGTYLPDLKYCTDGIIEMHYGKDVSSVTRSMNSDNIVTCLHAYGSYGDKTNGYCSLETAIHTEYVFTFTRFTPTPKWGWCISIPDESGLEKKYTFYPDREGYYKDDKLIFSTWDQASRMYVFDESRSVVDQTIDSGIPSSRFLQFYAYPVVEGQASITADEDMVIEGNIVHAGDQIKSWAIDWPHEYLNNTYRAAERSLIKVQNWTNSIMNFDYYHDVGLLSDEMILRIAEYQRTAAINSEAVYKATNLLSDTLSSLYSDIGTVDYVKLDVNSYSDVKSDEFNGTEYDDLFTGQLELALNVTDEHPHGVIYRTDYLEKEQNYFEWMTTEFLDMEGIKHAAKGEVLDINGDPIVSSAAYLVIVHAGEDDPSDAIQNNPRTVTDIKWTKGYLAYQDDEDNPTKLVFWIDYDKVEDLLDLEHDKIYLFKSNSINGNLGGLLSADEAAVEALDKTTIKVTEKHPVIFMTEEPSSSEIPDAERLTFNGYAWAWWQDQEHDGFGADEPARLYFCYTTHGDRKWYPVYFEEAKYLTDYDPAEAGSVTNKILINRRKTANEGDYLFDWSESKLWKCTHVAYPNDESMRSAEWTRLDGSDDKAIISQFGSIYRSCMTRNKYRFGQNEYYNYTHSSIIAPGALPLSGIENGEDYYVPVYQKWYYSYGHWYCTDYVEASSLPSNLTCDDIWEPSRIYRAPSAIDGAGPHYVSDISGYMKCTFDGNKWTIANGLIDKNSDELINKRKVFSLPKQAPAQGDYYVMITYDFNVYVHGDDNRWSNPVYKRISHLNPGNYFLRTPHQEIQVVTTDASTWHKGEIEYDTINTRMTHKPAATSTETILLSKAYRFDNVHYHPANNAEGHNWTHGYINPADGQTEDSREDYQFSPNTTAQWDLDDDYRSPEVDDKGETKPKVKIDWRTGSYIDVVNGAAYRIYGMYGNYKIFMYNANKQFIAYKTCRSYQGVLTFIATANTDATSYSIAGITIHEPEAKLPEEQIVSTSTSVKYIMISGDSNHSNAATLSFDNVVMTAVSRDTDIIVSDVVYKELKPVEGLGENMSILRYIREFTKVSDIAFEQYLPLKLRFEQIMKDTLNRMTESLGDLWREGYWQDDNYTEGKERLLYADALDNLREISKPEIDYNINFTDLFDSDRVFVPERDHFGNDGADLPAQLNILRLGMQDDDNETSELVAAALWPDLSINTAVHLIDQDMSINLWAFVDKLAKCYDKPWDTKITINTNLSTIGQHSFQDVMRHIAEVASGVKGRQGVVGSVNGRNITGAISGSQIENSTITGLQIRPSSLSISHISGLESAIDSAIQTFGSTFTFSTAQIVDLVAETAKIVRAEIKEANIDSAHIINLEAIKAQISSLIADSIQADSIDTKTLAAQIAQVAIANIEKANIANAKIEYSEIKYAHIIGEDVDNAFITVLSGNKVFIKDLAVTDGNIDRVRINQLYVVGDDGQYYQIVPSEKGGVLTSAITIDGESIEPESINASYKIKSDSITEGQIASGTITARNLNVANIMADTGFITNMIAGVANVGTLFANKAIAEQLAAHTLNSDYLDIAVSKKFQFSNGENLLPGTSDQPEEINNGNFCFGVVGVQQSTSRLSKIAFQCYIDCTECANEDEYWYPKVTVYAADGVVATTGDKIQAGEKGFAVVIADLPLSATAVQACLCSNYDMSGTCKYHSPKLEYGSIPTPWSLSPKDMEDRIREAELRVDPDAITATVKSKLNLSNGQNLISGTKTENTAIQFGPHVDAIDISDGGYVIDPENRFDYMTANVYIDASNTFWGNVFWVRATVETDAPQTSNAVFVENETPILNMSELGYLDTVGFAFEGNQRYGNRWKSGPQEEEREAEIEVLPIPPEPEPEPEPTPEPEPEPEPEPSMSGNDNEPDTIDESLESTGSIDDTTDNPDELQGWATVTFKLPENAKRVKVWICRGGDRYEYANGKTDLIYYHSAKLEYGDSPTPWSAMTNDIERRLTETELAVKDGAIESRVTDYLFNGKGAEKLETKITETSTDWTADFTRIDNELNSQKTWYRMDIDAFTIGKAGSNRYVEITNDQMNFRFDQLDDNAENGGIHFIEKGKDVASITGSKLQIADGVFNSSIQIGSLQASIDSAGNNITWAWI